MNDKQAIISRASTVDRSMTYQEQAYEFVKERIKSLDLRPGQRLTNSQVASDLDISRTPVREALNRLGQEGLLVKDGRRGWKVYSLSLEDVHEIFDIKVALERLMVRRAARCQDEKLRRALRKALRRMEESAEAGDLEGWQEADAELHRVIAAMAGYDRAAQIIDGLNDQWHRIRIGFVAMQGRVERSNPEHQAIVEAILAGDGDEAAREMALHLDNVRDELVRLLVNLVLPYTDNGI